eukprot:2448783-Pyramimonas_sp.AAC.1
MGFLCFDSPSVLSEWPCPSHFDQHCDENASGGSGAQSNPRLSSAALYLGLCADEPIQHPSGQQGAAFRLLDILLEVPPLEAGAPASAPSSEERQ